MLTTTATTRAGLGRLGDPRSVALPNGAAMTVVLFHVLVDFHIGLYGGTSAAMSPVRAANALRMALAAGWWLVALAVGFLAHFG